MKAVPSFPPFRPRPPWWGGDLQTLRNHLLRRRPSLDGYPAQRIEFAMTDGSGDALMAVLNRPDESAPPRPLVVLIHGLTGCEDSHYMLASARHFLSLGYPVLRLNLRGAGRSRARCRFRYHAGRSEDLRAVIGQMDGRLARRGLFLIGYSLGGNMLLKYLGEEGRRALVLGAASVSAPIDLKATQRRMMARRNWGYHRYILARMKEEFAALADAPGVADRLAAIRTIYAFDDRVVAPCNGFAGADDYYARCAALNFLPDIRVPTLVIHALNDPWIPADAYLGFDWAANRKLTPLLPKGGGHVGFHGLGGRAAWHDRCIARFLAALG